MHESGWPRSAASEVRELALSATTCHSRRTAVGSRAPLVDNIERPPVWQQIPPTHGSGPAVESRLTALARARDGAAPAVASALSTASSKWMRFAPRHDGFTRSASESGRKLARSGDGTRLR
jgi:hypothetical protein